MRSIDLLERTYSAKLTEEEREARHLYNVAEKPTYPLTKRNQHRGGHVGGCVNILPLLSGREGKHRNDPNDLHKCWYKYFIFASSAIPRQGIYRMEAVQVVLDRL